MARGEDGSHCSLQGTPLKYDSSTASTGSKKHDVRSIIGSPGRTFPPVHTLDVMADARALERACYEESLKGRPGAASSTGGSITRGAPVVVPELGKPRQSPLTYEDHGAPFASHLPRGSPVTTREPTPRLQEGEWGEVGHLRCQLGRRGDCLTSHRLPGLGAVPSTGPTGSAFVSCLELPPPLLPPRLEKMEIKLFHSQQRLFSNRELCLSALASGACAKHLPSLSTSSSREGPPSLPWPLAALLYSGPLHVLPSSCRGPTTQIGFRCPLSGGFLGAPSPPVQLWSYPMTL